jgi:hypothetical protein
VHEFKDIQPFVEKHACGKVEPDSDLFGLGINGDDFHNMMDEFADRFHVNMDGYLWYFHTNEEGQNIGGLLFPSPNKRVKRIPVTPLMLVEAANIGMWSCVYPKHSLPTKRWDIVINRSIAIILLAIALATILRNC